MVVRKTASGARGDICEKLRVIRTTRSNQFLARWTVECTPYISPRSTALNPTPVLGFSVFSLHGGLNAAHRAGPRASIGLQHGGSSPPKGGSADGLRDPLGLWHGWATRALETFCRQRTRKSQRTATADFAEQPPGETRFRWVAIIMVDPSARALARLGQRSPLQKIAAGPSDLAGSKFCRRFLGTPRSVNRAWSAPGRLGINAASSFYTWAYTKALHAAWPPRDDLVRAGKRIRTVLMTRVGVCQPVRARDRRAGALTTLPHGTRTRARDRGVPQ